jgi:GMP synthase (glutamine-hydrolysing)
MNQERETKNQELMTRIYALQHVATEPLGTIADALLARGIDVEYVRVYAGEAVPASLGDAAGLMVMGGPMGVYEQNELPFLRDEIRLIESALRDEKPVFGVCLGSQLLATALGAEVRQGERKEIGWFAVSLTEEGQRDRLFGNVAPSFNAYHWHGDVFDLPRGAVQLASSEQTTHQAFRFGSRAYGLLFHLEATPQIVSDMVTAFAGELAEERMSGDEIISSMNDHLPALKEIGATVFTRWAALLKRAD